MTKTFDLEVLAKEVMVEKGLEPQFSKEVLERVSRIQEAAKPTSDMQDLRTLLWSSIDNDDSKDLDQLTYAEKEKDGRTTLWVAIADVDALVVKDAAIDLHAQMNTTSVYTPAKIFPMLPEKLSTDLTSLNENVDRVAMVVKMKVTPEGEIQEGSIFQAVVHNFAKLTYNGVGAWLEERGEIPEKVKAVPGMEGVIRCQHEIAQVLKKKRHSLGALTLQSPEAEAKIDRDGQVVFQTDPHTVASELIENFMIAANHVMATEMLKNKIPSLRRVVRVPKNWNRIVEIATALGERLPEEPDPKALEDFLVKRKKADPETFPDLSLTVIKLLGRGEYVVENPGDKPIGHFGLALSEYTHSTAPNRRFPDLISQRQYKAFLRGKPNPYSLEELERLAKQCTDKEDAATHVERHMNKSAAAMLLSTHTGEVFEGIVTGVNENGVWARLFNPPVEGKVVENTYQLEVGNKIYLRLISVNIPRGFINLSRESS